MHWSVYHTDEFVNVERDDDVYRRCGEAIVGGMREGLFVAGAAEVSFRRGRLSETPLGPQFMNSISSEAVAGPLP
jgi:hypothetical protein